MPRASAGRAASGRAGLDDGSLDVSRADGSSRQWGADGAKGEPEGIERRRLAVLQPQQAHALRGTERDINGGGGMRQHERWSTPRPIRRSALSPARVDQAKVVDAWRLGRSIQLVFGAHRDVDLDRIGQRGQLGAGHRERAVTGGHYFLQVVGGERRDVMALYACTAQNVAAEDAPDQRQPRHADDDAGERVVSGKPHVSDQSGYSRRGLDLRATGAAEPAVGRQWSLTLPASRAAGRLRVELARAAVVGHQVVGGTLELAHRIADGAAQIGQLARAEDEQNDNENDDQMHRLQSAHDAFSPLCVNKWTRISNGRGPGRPLA